MERITQEQASALPHLRGFYNHMWLLDGLKQCCPFILTTGVHEGKCFATTRAGNPAAYVYGDSEVQAAYKLITTQQRRFEQSRLSYSFGFKIALKYDDRTEPETINAVKKIF